MESSSPDFLKLMYENSPSMERENAVVPNEVMRTVITDHFKLLSINGIKVAEKIVSAVTVKTAGMMY